MSEIIDISNFGNCPLCKKIEFFRYLNKAEIYVCWECYLKFPNKEAEKTKNQKIQIRGECFKCYKIIDTHVYYHHVEIAKQEKGAILCEDCWNGKLIVSPLWQIRSILEDNNKTVDVDLSKALEEVLLKEDKKGNKMQAYSISPGGCPDTPPIDPKEILVYAKKYGVEIDKLRKDFEPNITFEAAFHLFLYGERKLEYIKIKEKYEKQQKEYENQPEQFRRPGQKY